MDFARALAGIFLALSAAGCEKASSGGELTRGECVELAIRRDTLKNGEMGRANDANRRQDVDRCARSGTKRWADCIRFARNASDVNSCDEQL
jgi:hypothetical protein